MASVIPWEWELSWCFLAAIVLYVGFSLIRAVDQNQGRRAEVVYWMLAHLLQIHVFTCISCFVHAPPGSPESRRAVDSATLFILCLLLAHAWKATNNGLLFAAVVFYGVYLMFSHNVRFDGSEMAFCEML